MKIGACDLCNAQNVELAHSYVSGIETFHCLNGCSKATSDDLALADKYADELIELRNLVLELNRRLVLAQASLRLIAGRNDLAGVPQDDCPSAAYAALHECELIARNALEAMCN